MGTNEESLLRQSKRVRFFDGRLLTAQDLADEQDYLREKRRRHNRLLHGWGVVTGLEIATANDSGGKPKIFVSPGFALDPAGNEIVVPAPHQEEICIESAAVFIFLHYAEKETDPLPAQGADAEAQQFSRIEETFKIELEADNAACVQSLGVPLARLKFEQGRWEIDPDFRRPYVRH